MLVLTRKAGQAIWVGGPCTVRVARVQGNRVVLHFEMEDGTRILREELLDVVRTGGDVGPVPGDGGVDPAALGVGAETDQANG